MAAQNANYVSWTIPQLKGELSGRGAVTHGRKTDLIERLQAYDRNRDFRQPPILMPEPLDADWPVNGYQQLQEGHRVLLPKVTEEQIQGYFLYRMADQNANGKLKALEKARLMLEGERVLACSILMKDNIYLTGIVGAAMKNKVWYNYKIQLEKISWEPVNSHCECPAGRGPHGTCKHIATVLLMLENFISTGQMQVRKPCTESIQTFHKPKNHYQGEPLAAEILRSNKRRVSDDFLSDPRPEKYRNNPGYTVYVKNQVINYCASVSEDIGFRYLIKKADMQTASKDHDYCRLPFMEYWVDKATQVTDDKVRQIEEQTRLQSKSTYWMHQRMWRLTASRFGDIWKLTSRRNLLCLCKSLECTTSKNKRPLLHGRNYESKAIKAFEVKTGLKTKKCGLFVCQEIPCLGASPDAVIDDNEIVEVKYSGRDQDIKPGACFKFFEIW